MVAARPKWSCGSQTHHAPWIGVGTTVPFFHCIQIRRTNLRFHNQNAEIQHRLISHRACLKSKVVTKMQKLFILLVMITLAMQLSLQIDDSFVSSNDFILHYLVGGSHSQVVQQDSEARQQRRERPMRGKTPSRMPAVIQRKNELLLM